MHRGQRVLQVRRRIGLQMLCLPGKLDLLTNSPCSPPKSVNSIMCSSLTNLEGARRHRREEVLSGTCVLKNMMFLSPFVLGLHRLSPTIQEHALHDLTFLFCTNAENRRVFTSWDEWYVGVIFVYLEAWSERREQIIDSCINLIQVRRIDLWGREK